MNPTHLVAVITGTATLALPFAVMAQSENQPPPAGYCPHLSQTLTRGTRDGTTVPSGQVTELQKFLVDYYDLNPDVYVTGYFGRLTQQNVIRFQQEQGLPAYGIVGPLTRAAIATVCGSVASGTPSASATGLPAKIQQIQEALPRWLNQDPARQSSVQALMTALDMTMRAGNSAEAEKVADEILRVIGSSANASEYSGPNSSGSSSVQPRADVTAISALKPGLLVMSENGIIYTVRADGTGKKILSGSGHTPSSTPDGEIIFVSNRSATFQIGSWTRTAATLARSGTSLTTLFL